MCARVRWVTKFFLRPDDELFFKELDFLDFRKKHRKAKKCSKTKKILFKHKSSTKLLFEKFRRDAWIHHEQTLERAERHVRAVRLVQSADERYSKRRH
jgi:hypothetical protein